MSRAIVLARAIIIAAIVGDCGAIAIVAYRWLALSEAPGAETWSGLIALTACIVATLIQVRIFSKE